MKEKILKLKERIKSNKKFSLTCITFIEIMLIVLPILFNKAMPNVTGEIHNLDFLKNYFIRFFPFLSIALNTYPIKLLLDNKKLNEEVKTLEQEEKKSINEQEKINEKENINVNVKQEEINEKLEILKYMYKTDTDLYIMLLQDNLLENALKEKGYDDVTIKDFINYVKDDINGIKPLVRVK